MKIKEKGLTKPFYRMASWLYENRRTRRIFLLRSSQVDLDLKKVNPCEEQEEARKSYYVNKIALSLMLVFAGTFFAAVTAVKARMDPALQKDGRIVRGEEAQVLELEASIGENNAASKKRNFQIEVAPRQMTKEEIQPVYEKFAQELPDLILGENETLECVTEDLCLLDAYAGYPFLVEWISQRPDIISGTGKIYECETAEEMEITAVVTYADCEWKRNISVRAAPPKGTPEEEAYQELEAFLLMSEEAERLKQEWKLPEIWQGQTVEWEEVRGKDGLILWITSVVCAMAVYFLSDSDLHERTERRKVQMKREYPEIVHKLVLYLGAGMTVRGAFGKVAGEHVEGSSPAYEEMLYTFREIQAGVSEGKAYERFGKRSGLQEYIRLAMLLSQNLKKGNTAFLDRLREEADRAYLEQMQNSRRLTEEAATKLLLPMGMLLVVVMVMVMVPAFSSMGI